MAPKPVKVSLTQDDLEWLSKVASDRQRMRGYSSSGDAWRRGILPNSTLIGLVGEHAAARYLSEQLSIRLSVDTRDMPNGDGGVDLDVWGAKVQVKTRTRRSDFLIRREDERGKILTINWDYCVQATWESGVDPLVVTLDGCVAKRTLLRAGKFVVGRRGSWKNLQLDDTALLPMCYLVTSLVVRREFRGL